ncbi:hypothetical protein HYW99_00885, partial [Candidatus Woesearchaeota archaeon]|nr:hypothetical protein [Candidatus Woesearchaeota archaeon]
TNPTFLPYTIYSVDKKAQLDISEGTTISLNGQDVKDITVQQSYPNEVVTKDVPVHKKNDEIIQRQDIRYVIDNPVYTFEPTGILFNQFQRLTLYYDDETKDDSGVGILMGKQGFWIPIVSKHEPEYKRVYSNILGFTEFTAVYCASQPIKRAIAEHFFKPSGLCYFNLGITFIFAIASAVVLAGMLFPPAIGFTGTGIIGKTAASVYTGLKTLGITISTAYTATIGIAYLAISGITLATTIAGGMGAFYEQSPDNCQTLYPICEQNINLQKEEDSGTGNCIPSNSQHVSGGQPVNVCAFVKKCNSIKKFLCMPCSVKCTASFY